jgi:predicted NUDIX family NTP pyrophosphohydrolase
MAPRVLHGEISMAEARAKLSSGTLLYRHVDGSVEVLLVHPSGNYNRRAPWGIPKGAPNPDETLEATALRETLEETGLEVTGPLVDIGHVDYTRSKKRVHAFAAKAPEGSSCWVRQPTAQLSRRPRRSVGLSDTRALLGGQTCAPWQHSIACRFTT